MQTSLVIHALGGVREAARQLDVPPSTIASWKRVNRIPHWRWPTVAALLRELGEDVPS